MTPSPVSRDLDRLTASLDKTGAVKRIMDYLFFQTSAINGFDELGHYLRVAMVVNLCSTYAVDPTLGCEATFGAAGGLRNAVGRIGAAAASRALQASRRAGRPPRAPPAEASEKRRARGREAHARAARGASPALQGLDRAQPLLDYLLGDG